MIEWLINYMKWWAIFVVPVLVVFGLISLWSWVRKKRSRK